MGKEFICIFKFSTRIKQHMKEGMRLKKRKIFYKVGIIFCCFFDWIYISFLLSLGYLLLWDQEFSENIDWSIDQVITLINLLLYSGNSSHTLFVWFLLSIVAKLRRIKKIFFFNFLYSLRKQFVTDNSLSRKSTTTENSDVLENFIWMNTMGILK